MRQFWGGGVGSCLGVGDGLAAVLSSTLSAPLLVASAPLWTTFLVPCLILWPVFFAAWPVECAASLVSCLMPPLSCWSCASAPGESASPSRAAKRNFSFMQLP